MPFPVNHELLKKARSVLYSQQQVYWVIGGACSGKTTLCKHLAEKNDWELYDMDAHIFGHYRTRYTPERHPASREWFDQANGLAWVLSLSWEEFNELNAATNAEYLDLLAEDTTQTLPDKPLLIDGGISRPAVLARVMPTSRIICLRRPELSSRGCWDENEDRLAMKKMILKLEKGEEAWAKFLAFDHQLTRTLLDECSEHQIEIIDILPGDTIVQTAAMAMKFLNGTSGGT